MKHFALFLLLALGSIHAQDEASPTPETSTPAAAASATPEAAVSNTPTPSPTPESHGFTFNITTDDDKKQGHATASVPSNLEDIIIPVVAIVFSFGSPVLLVALILAYRMKKRRLLHQTIEQMVASGQPIPAELIVSSGAKSIPTVRSDCRRGIFLVCIGAGIIIWQLVERDSWGIGFIPLAIGVGYLLSSRFASRDGDKN